MTAVPELRFAAELERLTALVAERRGGDGAVDEILAGACRILGADGCALRDHEGRVLATAGAGVPGPGVAELEAPLPGAAGRDAAVLLVMRSGPLFGTVEEHVAGMLAGLLATARALQAQRTLLGGVLHELSTPLACVTGFTDALAGQWERLDDAARRDLLGRVREHGGELSDLVAQLSVHLAEPGPAVRAPERLSLAEECTTVVTLLEPVLDGRAIEVDVPDLAVTAERGGLRRTLTNLLTNAVKYSAAGTPITVRAAPAGEEVALSVVDHGVGMTPDEVARAFDLFWRAPDRDGVRGAGMGLSLVRDYVEGMGGRVEVRSEPGEGSTFTVTLPAA